jgi:hypothetical protein
MRDPLPKTWRSAAITTSVVVIAMTAYLILQGRVWWCQQGDLSPISLAVNSPHNSQHLLDAYSFSHLLHGVIFFGLFWLLRKHWPMPERFFVATLIEIVWETLENSPIIIAKYRANTMSLDYSGDSILNTLADIACCIGGFFLAQKLGLWWSVALIVVVELTLLFLIRDNLTLNVIMLLFPIDAIKQWQSAG